MSQAFLQVRVPLWAYVRVTVRIRAGWGVARVLVIGGGIAGTATALALCKAGLDVAVYEAHPDSAEDLGAFLTLASNGMRALAQIDASRAVTALGFPLTSMRVLDDAGAELAQVPLGEAAAPSSSSAACAAATSTPRCRRRRHAAVSPSGTAPASPPSRTDLPTSPRTSATAARPPATC